MIDSNDKNDVGSYSVRYEVTLKDGSVTIATDVAITYITLGDVCTLATLSAATDSDAPTTSIAMS